MAEVKYLDKTGLTSVWSKVKGIVTPKADKVSVATAGHLAGLNSSGNLMDSGLPASNIAQKDGSYSGMTVGAAEDLVSAESVASEFTSRITGGSTAVGKGGTALLDRIKGRTLVINQIVSNGDFSSETGWGIPVGGSLSYGPNGLSITFATRSTYSTQNYRSIIANHKYYFSVVYNQPSSGATTIVVRDSVSGTGNFIAVSSTSYGSFIRERRIGTANITGNHEISIIDAIEGSNTTIIKHIELVDLTLMFGAGNEPATPEEFEALYPGPYYDYNPGMLVSNAATAIETVGFNQWDEEWEGGSINDSDGQPATNSNYIRSKNFIPAFPSTEYYKTANARIFFYDAGKNYLGYTPTNAAGTFTTPAGTRYLKIRINYASPYQNDICISLSDPSRNGTYEPHWRSELDLNIPMLTGKRNGTGNSVVIFPDGLRSAGTVYDEIVGNKAIKRIGSVDLGERTWTLTEDGRGFYTTGLASLISSNAMVRYICPRYASVFNSSDSDQIAAADKTISVKVNGNAFIKDSAYTDANTFKASLSGVTLYYELATPEEYILDEAIPTAMRNDPYGTERRLPEDTAAIVTAPFRADITYSTNIKEAVQSMPQNYININSMQDFLAALGAQMGGTWTMRQADGKFDFTFTPNPSNE